MLHHWVCEILYWLYSLCTSQSYILHASATSHYKYCNNHYALTIGILTLEISNSNFWHWMLNSNNLQCYFMVQISGNNHFALTIGNLLFEISEYSILNSNKLQPAYLEQSCKSLKSQSSASTAKARYGLKGPSMVVLPGLQWLTAACWWNVTQVHWSIVEPWLEMQLHCPPKAVLFLSWHASGTVFHPPRLQTVCQLTKI